MKKTRTAGLFLYVFKTAGRRVPFFQEVNMKAVGLAVFGEEFEFGFAHSEVSLVP